MLYTYPDRKSYIFRYLTSGKAKIPKFIFKHNNLSSHVGNSLPLRDVITVVKILKLDISRKLVPPGFHRFLWKLQRERSFFVFSNHSAPLNARSIFVMKNCTYFTVFIHSSRMLLSSPCLSSLNLRMHGFSFFAACKFAPPPASPLSLSPSFSHFIYLSSHLASISIPLETS